MLITADRKSPKRWNPEVSIPEQEIEAARQEKVIAILTRALKWYANTTVYEYGSDCRVLAYDDGGKKARRAMERARKVK
jgi:hypothetical protein